MPGIAIDVLSAELDRIATGLTNDEGVWEQLLTIAETEDLLRVEARTIGLVNEQVVPVSDSVHVVFE